MELRVHLLKHIPIDFNDGVFSPLHKFNEKLSVYFVKSTVSVLSKFSKLHEDLQFDLRDSLNVVLAKIYQNKTSLVAEELGLPKEL
jgi:hypothetical protein